MAGCHGLAVAFAAYRVLALAGKATANVIDYLIFTLQVAT